LADDGSLRHNGGAVDFQDVGREVAALEQEIGQLKAAEQENDLALAALEAEVAARRDQLTQAQSAIDDLFAHIEEKRAELDEAIAEQVIGDRQAAAAALAEAVELLLQRLAAFDGSQEAARELAKTHARSHAAGRTWNTPIPPDLEADPEIIREPWDRLCSEIRNRIDGKFEDELVEAASRSPMGVAINDLPEHLREVARRRRLAMMQRDREVEAAARRSDSFQAAS
jgi:DNA repair exonuclease SbcCD ATPase subunit